MLIYCLIKFRHRRGGDEPAQIRGNTPLEVGWTVGAAVLLVVLTVVTFIYLGDIKNPPRPSGGGLTRRPSPQFASIDQSKPPGDPKRALEIDVNGQQYLWRYTIPNGAFAYYDMVVPVRHDGDPRTSPRRTSIHSWWIPKLGGKADAVPPATKYVNKTWFKVTERGKSLERVHRGIALPGRLRRAVRRQPRRHARARDRAAARPVPALGRRAEDAASTESQDALAAQREARNTRE